MKKEITREGGPNEQGGQKGGRNYKTSHPEGRRSTKGLAIPKTGRGGKKTITCGPAEKVGDHRRINSPAKRTCRRRTNRRWK